MPAAAADPLLAQCEFCDIVVPLKSLSAHAFACGNRTDVCEACLSYVRLCDMARHRESGCGVGATTTAAAREVRDSEATPLIGREENGEGTYHNPRLREEQVEMPSWATGVVVVAGVGAAIAFALLRRRGL